MFETIFRFATESERWRRWGFWRKKQTIFNMPRYKDDPPTVCVYTVCDESRYLIVRNAPALGCGDDLLKLFATYGDVEECKPMDAEDCEQFTDVHWIKFRLFSNVRFAKRKLDEFVFLGNSLQVSYASQFESLDDTKDKLEGRRKEILARLNHLKDIQFIICSLPMRLHHSLLHLSNTFQADKFLAKGCYKSHANNALITRVSSDKWRNLMEKYLRFADVHLSSVRDKLNKIQSSTEHLQARLSPKKTRVDNRRRI